MEKKEKDKPSYSEIHDRIATVERRLENRRGRLLDDAREAGQAATRTAARVFPYAAAAGAGLAAMMLARKLLAKPKRRSWRDEYEERRYRYRPRDHDESETRRGVRWASIAGIIGTAIRIGLHPQVRSTVQHLVERYRRRT